MGSSQYKKGKRGVFEKARNGEMRRICLIACVSLLASTGSGLAAECTKGMLWPYTRVAGDCLTDAEIAAGQKGTYSGPTNTNVDVSAIKPAEVPTQAGAVSGSVGGVGRSDGALIETSIFGAEPAARIVAQCNKGILWPFKREPGDCLTAAEKREGQTGVYGGGAAITQASVITAPPAAAGTSTGAPQAPPTAQAISCSKSWFWPFVKENGDCLTVAEKRGGQTGVYGGGAAITQASATTAAPSAAGSSTAAPPPAPAPQAVSCSKGWFWPFVREGGDCPSEADKKDSGQK
jgi:hypothetical protein